MTHEFDENDLKWCKGILLKPIYNIYKLPYVTIFCYLHPQFN